MQSYAFLFIGKLALAYTPPLTLIGNFQQFFNRSQGTTWILMVEGHNSSTSRRLILEGHNSLTHVLQIIYEFHVIIWICLLIAVCY